MNSPETFECRPLSARLMRSACAARHRRQRRDRAGIRVKGQFGSIVPHLLAGGCGTCPVGAAHARGEVARRWPDGVDVAVRLVDLRRSAS